MRTTLDIEDDILEAAKELAAREGTTAGRILSRLARQGLMGATRGASARGRLRNDVPLLPSRGQVVTAELVRRIADEEGI